MKTFDKLIEFKDLFVKNGFYSKNFQEINELWSESFGSVFKVKRRKDIDYYEGGLVWREREYSAMKRIKFTSDAEKDEIIREYFNYKWITKVNSKINI